MTMNHRPAPREQIGLPLYPAGVQRAITAQRTMAQRVTQEPRTARSYTPVPLDVDEDEDDDEVSCGYPQRPPSSTIRYTTPVQRTAAPMPARTHGRTQVVIERRRRTVQPAPIPVLPQQPATRHPHWLLMLGLGMLLMLLAWVGLSLLLQWWQVHQDDVQYGRPRTFQLDAVVGHQDSASNPTHLLVVNLNRHVIVTEYPGGDAQHARVYLGPVLIGPGQDLAPVTLQVKDVNGDGKPDLLLDIQGNIVVFLNDGPTFRPLKPGERVSV